MRHVATNGVLAAILGDAKTCEIQLRPRLHLHSKTGNVPRTGNVAQKMHSQKVCRPLHMPHTVWVKKHVASSLRHLTSFGQNAVWIFNSDFPCDIFFDSQGILSRWVCGRGHMVGNLFSSGTNKRRHSSMTCCGFEPQKSGRYIFFLNIWRRLSDTDLYSISRDAHTYISRGIAYRFWLAV